MQSDPVTPRNVALLMLAVAGWFAVLGWLARHGGEWSGLGAYVFLFPVLLLLTDRARARPLRGASLRLWALTGALCGLAIGVARLAFGHAWWSAAAAAALLAPLAALQARLWLAR